MGPKNAERSGGGFARAADYRQEYAKSLRDPNSYWATRANELVTWYRKWDSVLCGDFLSDSISWFSGALLNASYNCLDRHIEKGDGEKTALIWQGEDESDTKIFTYRSLHKEVCRFANLLKKRGVGQGDCVTVYLPMIPEMVISVLACARIGAVHCVVFSGFSATSLAKRIVDCNAHLLITADAAFRAGRVIPMKANADEAFDEAPSLNACIVVRRTGKEVSMKPGRDFFWHEEISADDITDYCSPAKMQADTPLYVLYTSGATGDPKGVVHRTGGYLLYAMHSCQWVFDLKKNDIFWCTADCGWITGHTYMIYGPLGLGGTVLMYEGIPLYPGPGRFWEIVEKYKVSIFYTAPAVIRALMRYGPEPISQHDISSLRLLGSVGEPINPDVWRWYHKYVGSGSLPIVDTWWQTEAGGVMIAPLPSMYLEKPGSAAQPLPGIDAAILDWHGQEAPADESGQLVIRHPWPGMLKNLFGKADSVRKEYCSRFPGVFNTGDRARRDADGDFWIVGRTDDAVNVCGNRLDTVEIESALLRHPAVLEAAVVGMPHPDKGEVVYAYVTIREGCSKSSQLLEDLRRHVRGEVGPVASPHVIQYAAALPKTRSGKIIRRILRQIASDDLGDFGDLTTLADPSVIPDLIEGKRVEVE